MLSKCVKCGNSTFEMVVTELLSSQHKHKFIQCASCGGVVGVQDGYNNAAMLVEQNKVINAMARMMNVSSNLKEN